MTQRALESGMYFTRQWMTRHENWAFQPEPGEHFSDDTLERRPSQFNDNRKIKRTYPGEHFPDRRRHFASHNWGTISETIPGTWAGF